MADRGSALHCEVAQITMAWLGFEVIPSTAETGAAVMDNKATEIRMWTMKEEDISPPRVVTM